MFYEERKYIQHIWLPSTTVWYDTLNVDNFVYKKTPKGTLLNVYALYCFFNVIFVSAISPRANLVTITIMKEQLYQSKPSQPITDLNSINGAVLHEVLYFLE